MALAVMSRAPPRLYSMSVRDRVMDPARGGTDAERCANICSTRTVARWRKRQRDEGNYEPRGRGEWRRGRGFAASTMGVLLLFWFQLQVPNAPRRYCQTLLARTTRQLRGGALNGHRRRSKPR